MAVRSRCSQCKWAEKNRSVGRKATLTERKENQRGFQRMMLKGKFFSGCRLSCHPRAKSWLSLLSQKTLRPNTQQIVASARETI